MIRKEEGVSYDGFPGLSRTTPLACLSVVGWYPKATSGARRSRRRLGLTAFTFFQTEYGTPSGPGAEEGEDLARAAAISSLLRGPQLLRVFFFFFFFIMCFVLFIL